MASLLTCGTLAIVCIFLAQTMNNVSGYRTQSGICSWYGGGGTTASGEPFNENAMTGAHLNLPFNTRVQIKYNGKQVTLRVTDRGPFVPGRIFDMSRGAAAHLGIIDKGIIPCTIEILDGSSNHPGNPGGNKYPNKGCKPLWDNTCVKHTECCTGKCDKKSHWKTGVCKK